MKIIRQGKSKEELERIMNKTKRFGCKRCECIFEANKSEYKYEDDYIYGEYWCKCPNCGDRAYEQIHYSGIRRMNDGSC